MKQVLTARILSNEVLNNQLKLGLSWLPNAALDELINLSRALIIYDSDKCTLQFYDIQSDVYQIAIRFSRFSAQIISKMLHHLREVTTKIIFSKGINYDQEYIWQGFFQKADLQKSLEDLPEVMKDIKNVIEINWQKVEVT